jgi:hypothetical protein
MLYLSPINGSLSLSTQQWALIRPSSKMGRNYQKVSVLTMKKEEKFFRGCTHKAARLSRIHAYAWEQEGQEAQIQFQGLGQRFLLWQCPLRANTSQRDYSMAEPRSAVSAGSYGSKRTTGIHAMR